MPRGGAAAVGSAMKSDEEEDREMTNLDEREMTDLDDQPYTSDEDQPVDDAVDGGNAAGYTSFGVVDAQMDSGDDRTNMQPEPEPQTSVSDKATGFFSSLFGGGAAAAATSQDEAQDQDADDRASDALDAAAAAAVVAGSAAAVAAGQKTNLRFGGDFADDRA